MDLKFITELELMKPGGVYSRLDALEGGPGSFSVWKADIAPALGRVTTGAAAGGILGLGWAGSVNDRIAENSAMINKLCDLAEFKGLSAGAE